MLAKVCLKRFRFVLYAALFFLITLHITDRTNSGLIATVCIWFALPLAFIAFVWWIYACIRDIVRFFKSGAVPEDAPTWAERAVWWVQDELAEIASLDGRGKVRFFLFRVGGVALAALGLVLIVRDSIVSGTMLLIGGLALCVSASPQSVNRNSPDIKMLGLSRRGDGGIHLQRLCGCGYPAGQALHGENQNHFQRRGHLGAERRRRIYLSLCEQKQTLSASQLERYSRMDHLRHTRRPKERRAAGHA